jgi:hypothetical protein
MGAKTLMAFNPDEWELIKFVGTETPASLGLPFEICNMTNPLSIAPALFLAKRVNPQRFYWINTMSRIPAGVSQAVSEGHSPNEFPQGYGGASCDGTPWPPVDPPPAPLPANYTLMSGKAIGGQDIKGFSSFSDCQAACDADPNCAGFTVMASSRTGATGRWCGLKSSTTTMGPNATFDTFTKKSRGHLARCDGRRPAAGDSISPATSCKHNNTNQPATCCHHHDHPDTRSHGPQERPSEMVVLGDGRRSGLALVDRDRCSITEA